MTPVAYEGRAEIVRIHERSPVEARPRSRNLRIASLTDLYRDVIMESPIGTRKWRY